MSFAVAGRIRCLGVAAALGALLALPSPSFARHPTDAEMAQCRDSAQTLSHCPDEGCPAWYRPQLNRAKNRTDAVTNPDSMTIAQVIALQKSIHRSWKEDQPASSMRRAGEGKGVIVEGYLAHDAPEMAGESCNCYLKEEADNDVHLSLVELVKNAKDTRRARGKSIVAEMTPRVRKDHPGWTTANLEEIRSNHRRLRVTGWLMLDTQHVKDHRGGPRATLWEVHPVTKVEVSDGTQWLDLDRYAPDPPR